MKLLTFPSKALPPQFSFSADGNSVLANARGKCFPLLLLTRPTSGLSANTDGSIFKINSDTSHHPHSHHPSPSHQCLWHWVHSLCPHPCSSGAYFQLCSQSNPLKSESDHISARNSPITPHFTQSKNTSPIQYGPHYVFRTAHLLTHLLLLSPRLSSPRLQGPPGPSVTAALPGTPLDWDFVLAPLSFNLFSQIWWLIPCVLPVFAWITLSRYGLFNLNIGPLLQMLLFPGNPEPPYSIFFYSIFFLITLQKTLYNLLVCYICYLLSAPLSAPRM